MNNNCKNDEKTKITKVNYTKTKMQFKDEAIDTALTSTHSTFKHGALLVQGNYILAQASNDFYQHAEANALTEYLYSVLRGQRQAKVY